MSIICIIFEETKKKLNYFILIKNIIVFNEKDVT